MNLMTDCKLEFFPSITKTPPTSWISNLVPVSLCDSWCCFRFLFFSHNIVFLICVSPRSLWHQSHGPKSSWHLGGRTLSTHAPSQRLRIQHVNHVDTSIASMVSWVSLQRIGSTRATLTWENLIVLQPSQILRLVFWSLFSLIKPHGCYTLPRFILNRMYIHSKSYSPQDPCMAI